MQVTVVSSDNVIVITDDPAATACTLLSTIVAASVVADASEVTVTPSGRFATSIALSASPTCIVKSSADGSSGSSASGFLIVKGTSHVLLESDLNVIVPVKSFSNAPKSKVANNVISIVPASEPDEIENKVSS